MSIFFVISGFLITLLLIRESHRTGRISLRGFYLRRAFRILPAYVAYLLVIAGISGLGYIHPSGSDWLIALTYTGSIFHAKSWELGHMWSLSIEEQFYLAWPFLLVLLGQRRGAILAVGCVGVSVLARAIGAIHFQMVDDYFTPCRMECIALGCFLAIALTEPSFWKVRRLLSRGGVWPGVLASIGLALTFALTTREVIHPLLQSCASPWVVDSIRGKCVIVVNAVNATLICAIIWSFCRYSERWPGRVLESRPLVTLGVLSYSIYIWQQPFLNWSHKNWCLSQWPFNLIGVGLAATASYFLIESPFLRLKERWKS